MFSFKEVCESFENILRTSSRLEIQEIYTKLLKSVIKKDKEALNCVLYISTNKIYPDYYNIELGIGESTVKMVVSESTGLKLDTLKKMLQKTGDLSVIAMENKVNQLFAPKQGLTVDKVFSCLKQICEEVGSNSQKVKKNLMLSLLASSSPIEIKYLVRMFESKLKIGLALQTVLSSLAKAFDVDENLVKSAYNKQPNFDILVEHLFNDKIDSVEIKPGIPLKPMLAQPSKNLTSAFSKFSNEKFLSEYKYDGERIQIHFDGKKISVFSRNSENLELKYPDLLEFNLSSKSYILDGEVVAYDNEILPFQVLSTRKRKGGELTVKICVFAFDLLYYDDEELINLSLEKRRKILFENFTETPNFKFADYFVCNTVDDIDNHYKGAVGSNCEGVMIKSLKSPYLPSQRSNSWIKIKKDYLDLGDTMDLVVMGAFYGKGKRTGTFGNFLMGVYNDETDKFEPCCKLGTGFTDEDLHSIYSKLSDIITMDTSEYICNNLSPDVWVEPFYVWEVKAASLSLSPLYLAGNINDKGISLRFPRFIRCRDDKISRSATTSKQLSEMYTESLE